MNNLTKLRTLLAEKKALADAATAGPWHQCMDGWTVRQGDTDRRGEAVCRTYARGGDVEKQVSDSEFIAAARTDLPALITLVEAMLKHLEDDRWYDDHENAVRARDYRLARYVAILEGGK